MAGKRQHYIPQFLQRGFTIEKNGAKTWVTRVDRKPYQSNIQNVGVEGYFYTKEDDVLVDEIITEEEIAISSMINDLKKCKHGEIIYSKEVAKLIVHFEIRTRNLRVNFSQAFQNITEVIADTVKNQNIFLKYLRKKISTDAFLIEEQIKELPISSSQRNMWITIFQKNPDLIINNIPEYILSNLACQITQQISIEIINKIAKDGHLKALKDTISPERKVITFSKLSFKIIKTEESLILGDSIVIFVNSLDRFKPFYEKNDIIKSIILPLDERTCIIGSNISNQSYSIHEIREMISSCSLEFFISTDEKIAFQYGKNIGKHAKFLTKEQAYDMIDGILNE